MRIAIIGLGRMGRALADRLLDDSHEVSVWNRTPGRAAELQERGARVLGSADDVHEESDAVLLCLADAAAPSTWRLRRVRRGRAGHRPWWSTRRLSLPTPSLPL